MTALIRNLNLFLDKRLKTHFLIYFICLFIVSFLEAIGISIIPIIISLHLKEGIFYEKLPDNIINYFSGLSLNNFLILSFFIIIGTFLIKNIIIILINRYSLIISKNLTAKTTAEVIKKLFKKDFLLFKESTIGEKIRDVTIETNHSTMSIFNLFSIYQDIIFLILIITLLVSTSSSISILMIGGLLIVSSIIFKSYSALIRKLSISLVKSREKLFNEIFEISNLIREIKIIKKENFFIDKFQFHHNKFLQRNYKKLLILSIPKHVIEIFAVFFILLIIFNNIFLNELSFREIIPQLTLIIISALKAIPIINALIIKISNSKSLNVSYEIISKYLREKVKLSKKIKPKYSKKISSLKLKNFTFNYKNKTIFKDQNFSLRAGDFIGIFGPSGEGKSTLLDILTGTLKINKGSVFYNGKKIDDISKLDLNFAFVPQNPKLINSSLKENIALGVDKEKINTFKIKSLIKMVGLNDFVINKKKGMDYFVGDSGNLLSGGQVQRIAIARALYNNPDILIFDEPTSALDKANERLIFNLIFKIFKENKKMIIIYVSHQYSLIKKSNKKFLVKNQKIKSIK